MTSPTGQLLMVGVPGTELDAETAAVLRRLQPGAFILFGRNIQTPTQLRRLIDDLRDLSEVEPIITIDQEGGRVSRLKLIGSEPPNAQQLRDRGDRSLIQRHGEITAEVLRLFGFNLDLCPVLDISFDDEADNSLRGRCYGKTATQVIDFAGAFNDSLRAGGILSCGKHFPGYSCAGEDPHHDFPSVDRPRAEMEAHELAVFRHFARTEAGSPRIDSLMIGHIHYPDLDPVRRPASLSPKLLDELLVREMGFRGLIMTDDLDMGAILNFCGFDEAIEQSVRAGNHLAMLCHRVHLAEQAGKVLAALPAAVTAPALEAVARFKTKLAPPTPFSEERFREIDARIYDLRVATLGEEAAARRSPEDGKRSPVELY